MKYLCDSCANFPCTKDMNKMEVSCPIYSPEPKTTNYDRLRAKSMEEMAEFVGCDPMHDICPNDCHDDLDRPCKVCALDWLKQEVRE